jgi:type IV pilus assembly protein PilQ
MSGALTRVFAIEALLLMFGMVQVPTLHAQARISLDVHNADVRETLRTLAAAGSLNLVIGPDVKGTVTLRLQDVPIEEALEILLRVTGLVQVHVGRAIGILSREAFLQQQRQQAAMHTLGIGPVRTAIVPLRYAKAAELAHLLATLLSPWGTIAVDEGTNSLIIRDIPESPIFQKNQVTP